MQQPGTLTREERGGAVLVAHHLALSPGPRVVLPGLAAAGQSGSVHGLPLDTAGRRCPKVNREPRRHGLMTAPRTVLRKGRMGENRRFVEWAERPNDCRIAPRRVAGPALEGAARDRSSGPSTANPLFLRVCRRDRVPPPASVAMPNRRKIDG